MNRKVLLVDDDPNVLRGLQRQLGGSYALEIAEGGDMGLALMDAMGPFAAVVADMRMPGMDGIVFLEQVQRRHPYTVRLMLTGNADMQTAVGAVNQGSVFRFLTKPCPLHQLREALDAAVAQFNRGAIERDLLRDTLTGCMKVFTDIIALQDPVAFGRGARVGHYVKHIALQLELSDPWEFELAGMLSQVGCVTLSAATRERLYARNALTTEDCTHFAHHPAAGRRMLQNIPRFETIAEIVGRQQERDVRASACSLDLTDRVAIGVQILQVALDLDDLLSGGYTFNDAWHKLSARSGSYHPELLSALMDLHTGRTAEEIRNVNVDELHVGMAAEEDIVDRQGTVLVIAGSPINYPTLLRIREAAASGQVEEPCTVRVGGWVLGGSRMAALNRTGG